MKNSLKRGLEREARGVAKPRRSKRSCVERPFVPPSRAGRFGSVSKLFLPGLPLSLMTGGSAFGPETAEQQMSVAEDVLTSFSLGGAAQASWSGLRALLRDHHPNSSLHLLETTLFIAFLTLLFGWHLKSKRERQQCTQERSSPSCPQQQPRDICEVFQGLPRSTSATGSFYDFSPLIEADKEFETEPGEASWTSGSDTGELSTEELGDCDTGDLGWAEARLLAHSRAYKPPLPPRSRKKGRSARGANQEATVPGPLDGSGRSIRQPSFSGRGGRVLKRSLSADAGTRMRMGRTSHTAPRPKPRLWNRRFRSARLLETGHSESDESADDAGDKCPLMKQACARPEVLEGHMVRVKGQGEGMILRRIRRRGRQTKFEVIFTDGQLHKLALKRSDSKGHVPFTLLP